MSKAKPKIASYPFTTLHPLIGTIHYKDGYKDFVAFNQGLALGIEGSGAHV
jgi:GTPase involved in cell partitioning and DNA repair